jgi:hypothetical protein
MINNLPYKDRINKYYAIKNQDLNLRHILKNPSFSTPHSAATIDSDHTLAVVAGQHFLKSKIMNEIFLGFDVRYPMDANETLKYSRYEKIYNNIFSYFFDIEELVFCEKLPLWCCLKDPVVCIYENVDIPFNLNLQEQKKKKEQKEKTKIPTAILRRSKLKRHDADSSKEYHIIAEPKLDQDVPSNIFF